MKGTDLELKDVRFHHGHDDGHEHTHTYTHSHGGGEHTHTHAHGHRHVHSEEEKKAVKNRLARAIGHLEKVKRMVEADEDCSDVLVQLAAVRSAINNTGKLILKNHINHCVIEAIQDEDLETLEKMGDAINLFIK